MCVSVEMSSGSTKPSDKCKSDIEQTCGKNMYEMGPVCEKCVKKHMKKIEAGANNHCTNAGTT